MNIKTIKETAEILIFKVESEETFSLQNPTNQDFHLNTVISFVEPIRSKEWRKKEKKSKKNLEKEFRFVQDRTILLENLFNISIDEIFDESMAKKIAKDGHSKIPIYRETPKNIIGLLPVKKLIGVSYGTPVSQIPLVSTSGVPSNKPLSDLLSEFQIKGGNVRLVYEAETSILIGMITLDDLMQEMKEEIHIESSKTTEADERSSRLKNRKETERDVRSDRKINIVIEPNTSKEVLDQRRPTLDWEF